MDTSSPADAGTSNTEVVPAPAPAAAPASPVLVPSATLPVVASTSTPAVSTPEAVAAPALREDQVQNAVGFLSHPQVRGSTNIASKRSFLERKGLTAAEIDEAFRRVPEAPAAAPALAPSPAPAPAAAHAHPAQPATYSPQQGAQAQQLVVAQQPYGGTTAPNGTQLVAVHPAAPQSTAVLQAAEGYRWSQVVLGVGVVAAAGWAVQQLVLPRLRSLVDSWQSSRREAEEKRNKELATSVDVLRNCQQELKASTQALMEAVTLMREQQRVAAAMAALPGGSYGRGAEHGRRPADGPDGNSYYPSISGRSSRYGIGYGANESTYGAENFATMRAAAGYVNGYPPEAAAPLPYGYSRDGAASGPVSAGPTGGDGGRGVGGSGPTYATPTSPYGAVRSAASGPYGGGSAVQQEALPYRVTAPPSPTQSVHSLQSIRQPQQQPGGMGGVGGPYGSSDRLYDQSLPGGVVVEQEQSQGASPAGPAGARTQPRAPPEQPAYPQSFHEVMEMVQKGITPPNVRTDINDAPPDPTRPLSDSRLTAPAKPWERSAAAAAGSSGSASAFGATAAAGTPYGSAAGGVAPRAYGSYGYGASSQYDANTSASYGAASSSSTGASGGAGSLNVLPPANPTWRPPPPPMRTVGSSNPAAAAAAAPEVPAVADGAGGRTSSAPAAVAVAASISDAPPPPSSPPQAVVASGPASAGPVGGAVDEPEGAAAPVTASE